MYLECSSSSASGKVASACQYGVRCDCVGPTTNWTSARTHWNRSSLLAVNKATIDIGVIISNHLTFDIVSAFACIPRKVSKTQKMIHNN